jgi:3-phenylpropionate/trans-cinnamate dioxygenase ferredoxin reductase subunit
VKRVAIVGASLAGLRAAEALRAQGFDGEIVVFGAEPHRPYDRTTLTKGYLEGALDDADIELAEEADLAALDLDLRLGEPVLGLRPADRAVILGSDRIHRSDAVIIATGARARAIPVAGRLPSSAVHAVRDLGDARRLRRELAKRPSRVVVVGSGFLGSEVASVARRVGI